MKKLAKKHAPRPNFIDEVDNVTESMFLHFLWVVSVSFKDGAPS